MRPLQSHVPSAEQLPLVMDEKPGAVLVRGAAGSGKTTSALLRLDFVTNWWLSDRARVGSSEPVNVLALTFNKTLEAYIRNLAHSQVGSNPLLNMQVSTLAKWNKRLVGFHGSIYDDPMRADRIWTLGQHLGYSRNFLVDEVDYILGRFPPNRLGDYLDPAVLRLGRGQTPRVSAAMRARLMTEVVEPLIQYKQDHDLVDWNDLTVLAAATPPTAQSIKHVVVIDEAQDFSVNQMRSVVTHLNPTHSMTLITDTAQRIYPRYLSYPEAGVPAFRRTHLLTTNYRNTPQIAALAASVLDGITLDADTALPSQNTAREDGKMPELISGRFRHQMDWTIKKLRNIDLEQESAVIVTPRGGGWQSTLLSRLDAAGLEYAGLQRADYWPDDDINLGVSTLHSSKGLEFDHVFILGLNNELTAHGDGEDDANLDQLRRLFGMAIGRARITVTIGYASHDPSKLLDYVDKRLVDHVEL